jgi:HPt (histidine-containing phosphotransfer) domain-containing protein
MTESGNNDFGIGGDDELLQQYIDWTKGAAAELRQLIDGFEAAENKPEISSQIYDIAHNIKGMGGSFDFALMTQIGASFCNYLKTKNALPEGPTHRAMNAHIRAIEVVIENEISGTGGDKGQMLLDRLITIVAEED